MNDLKPAKPKEKPEIRKGQIRSITAKNNTINKKNANKSKSVKAPILAVKTKKKLKKKASNTQKSIELNSQRRESLKQKKSGPPPPMMSSESSQGKDITRKSHQSTKGNKKVSNKDHMSEDEVVYEQVSGVNERRRR